MLDHNNISNQPYYPTKEEFLIQFDRLTKRQKEVVILKCRGLTDEQIALECGFKKRTVSRHLCDACATLLISDPDKKRNNANRETLVRLGTLYLFNDN